MPLTFNYDFENLSALTTPLDDVSLETVTLVHQAALDAFSLVENFTVSQLSSTRVELTADTFTVALTGSGIGPVSTLEALQAAIEDSTATGDFDRITVEQSGTTILEIAFASSGLTLTSGTTVLELLGGYPGSLTELFTLAGELEQLANLDTATEAEVTALQQALAPFGPTGLVLSENGEELLSLTTSETGARLAAGGFELGLTGTLPQSLGDLIPIVRDLDAQFLLQAPDVQVSLFNAAGTLLYSSFGNELSFDAFLPAGRYYAQVSSLSFGGGDYRLTVGTYGATSAGLMIEGDAGQDPGSAQIMPINSAVDGFLSPAGDVDWYGFDYDGAGPVVVRASERVNFDLVSGFDIDGLSIAGPNGETLVEVTGDFLGGLDDPGLFDTFAIDGQAYTSVWLDLPLQSGGANNLLDIYEPGSFAGGLGGNDTLQAHGEDVTLDGGTGNDRLVGSTFSDVLRGGDGADTLIGGGGDDSIVGGATDADLRDVVFGGDGDDTIEGGAGNDELRGDAGNDDIAGGAGADTVIGGAGDDVMTGSNFGDVIFGGDGFDFINGGFGSDRLNGGNDADRFFHVGVAGHGSDWIQDYDAAEGDVLLYGGSASIDQFQVNRANTANAGEASVDEAFVIYKPSGQILWALVDGFGNDAINIRIGGVEYDLLG